MVMARRGYTLTAILKEWDVATIAGPVNVFDKMVAEYLSNGWEPFGDIRTLPSPGSDWGLHFLTMKREVKKDENEH